MHTIDRIVSGYAECVTGVRQRERGRQISSQTEETKVLRQKREGQADRHRQKRQRY